MRQHIPSDCNFDTSKEPLLRKETGCSTFHIDDQFNDPIRYNDSKCLPLAIVNTHSTYSLTEDVMYSLTEGVTY